MSSGGDGSGLSQVEQVQELAESIYGSIHCNTVSVAHTGAIPQEIL